MSIRRAVAAVVLWFGCGDDGTRLVDAPIIDAPPPVDAPLDRRQLVAEVFGTSSRSLDLLLVIDDSPGMLDKHANLAASLPSLISGLGTIPGGLLDLHVGVVSTDMGTKGSEVVTPGPTIGQINNGGCSGTGKRGNLMTYGAPINGTFLSDIRQADGTRLKNYTGTVETVLGTVINQTNAGGCGFEQPLAAMQAALNNNPANAGFLRPEVLLAVVFLTDEDDCSFRTPTVLGPESQLLGPLDSFRCARFGVTCTAGGLTSDQMNQVGTKTGCSARTNSLYLTDVATYRDFLMTLKGDARRVVVGSIAGSPTPVAVELRPPPQGGTAIPALARSCTYAGANVPEVADPPIRLASFLGEFPDTSAESTICQRDLSMGLSAIAALVMRKLGSPCLAVRLGDQDPNQSGPQVDCAVDDAVGSAVTPVPPCSATQPSTCWRLETDAATCPLADHLKLVIARAQAPDPATVTRMRCLVQ